MRDICKYLQIDTKIYRERNLLAAISAAKNEMVSPKEFRLRAEGDFSRQKIASVYEEYEKQMQANNALDFDDLLVKAVQLLKTQPDVLDYYQERFRYIMVDEYQDTNNVQFQFVSTLAAKYRNLCVVGDDDQSIYKFRGADIRNILNFENVFEDATVIKLEQNYRSTGTILDAANAVIRNNRGRKEKTLWTENGQGEKIEVRQFDSGYEEAEYIVGEIRGQRATPGRAPTMRTPSSTAPTPSPVSLRRSWCRPACPTSWWAASTSMPGREIKDLLAYLKTIDNAKDDLAVRRIINVPKRGIGLTSVNRVQEYALRKEIGFYEALLCADLIPGIGRGLAKLESFAALMEHFKAEAAGKGILELLEEILDVTGYIEDLKSEGEIEAEAQDREYRGAEKQGRGLRGELPGAGRGADTERLPGGSGPCG